MLEAGNIWQLTEARAEATPDRELAVDRDCRRLAFGEYRDRCERVAAGLATRGVAAGTVVSWQLPTWLESMVLFGALRRLGAVQNPILPIYREREVGAIVAQARPALLIVPSTWRGFDFETMARRLTDGTSTEVLVCDRDLPEGDPSMLPPAPAEDMRAGDAPVRYLYFTSGTTSEPKGAQHGDLALWAAAVSMSDGLGLAEDDRFALVFPFTHIAGGVYVCTALAHGLAFIVDEAFDPAATVDLLRRERVTQAGAGTYFHQVYLEAQRALPPGASLFPEVRTFPGGGAPKPPHLHRAMAEAFGGAGIVSGYGLTEAPIVTMAGVDDPDDVLATTEGRPRYPGTELELVTLDGRVAGTGEEGEIRVRGPQVTRGYLDPALDAEAFDEDGWFRTGDLGRRDAGGNLTITGRTKDVIIRKGENIPAKELEDLLAAHPGVADVAVVGLPDEEVGERACAVVVPADGGRPLALDEVVRYLTEQGISTRKLPERLELVDALPRSPAGKVLKSALRDRYASGG